MKIDFTDYEKKMTKSIEKSASLISLFSLLSFFLLPVLPKHKFYYWLNDLIDKYLFGDFFPEPSEKFYFSMKILFYFSILLFIVVFFSSIYFFVKFWGRKKVCFYFRRMKNIESSFKKEAMKAIFYAMIGMGMFYFGMIGPYAFGMKTHSGSFDFWHNLFFQNIYPSLILLIICQNFLFLFTVGFALFICFCFYRITE